VSRRAPALWLLALLCACGVKANPRPPEPAPAHPGPAVPAAPSRP
jgi:hypothetical protein